MVHSRYIIFSNIMLVIMVIFGFTTIQLNSIHQYNALMNQKIENDLSQTALTVESDIDNDTNVMLAVASSMAEDSTVRRWLNSEPYSSTAAIITYLSDRSKAFNYDIAYLISDKTRRLYTQTAYLYELDSNTPEHEWYDRFVASKKQHKISIDLNDADDYAISIFVHTRIEDNHENYMGVIGVAENLSSLWEKYDSIEKDKEQHIYIVPLNNDENIFLETTGHYVQPEDLVYKLNIRDSYLFGSTENGNFITSGSERIFIKRICSVDWAVVVTEHDISLAESMAAGLRANAIYVIFLSVVMVILSVLGMRRVNLKLHNLENIDRRTGLPNQELFSEQFRKLRMGQFSNPCSFFTLSIDNIENISKDMGLVYQSAVINIVSDELVKITENHGIIGGWERKEYIGWLDMSPENAYRLLIKLNLRLSEQDKKVPITVSIGITNARGTRSLPILAMQAERAMFRSMRNGSGICTIYDSEIDGVVSIIAAD